MSFSFFSHGQGEVSKHERERAVSVSVMAKTDKGIFLLFYSCSASKQTVWFRASVSGRTDVIYVQISLPYAEKFDPGRMTYVQLL